MLKIILFLILLNLSYWPLHFFIQWRVENQPYLEHGAYYDKYRQLFSPARHYPVVIMGASHSLHSLNPKYLDSADYLHYNLAMHGAGPSMNLQIYEHVLRKQKTKPDFVIYGVNWFLFKKGVLWRQMHHDVVYYPLSSYIQIFPSLVSYPVSLKKLIKNKLTFFNDKGKLLQMVFEQSPGHFRLQDLHQGFISFEQSYQHCDENFQQQNELIKRDGPQLQAFEKMLKLMQSDGISVILLQPPEYYTCYQNQVQVEFLAKLAQRYKVPFLNYNLDNNALTKNKGNFASWGHMNGHGSRLFSMQIKDHLHQIYRNYESH